MCGIFGYIGAGQAVPRCITGLKKLEYRGYDSAGVAYLDGGKLSFKKQKGKIAALQDELNKAEYPSGVAIGHTRWATHGEPNQVNAHPHLDQNRTLAVVHNGIVENFESLKETLIAKGVKFRSKTDSEVIAQLVADRYQGDLLSAVQEVMPLLKGSLAMALVHKDEPGTIIAAAKGSPLVIGIGNGEAFVSSDTNAFLVHTRKVLYLHDSEVAKVQPGHVELYDETTEQVMREAKTLAREVEEASKGKYPHYMLKEIHEQPQTIRNALYSRYMHETGNAFFEELQKGQFDLQEVRRILILGCGTSWHAGAIASYMFEEMARIPVQCEIASEFRYKNPIVEKGTLAIAISQSGETADTIAAIRELREKGAKVVSLCNVQGSTIDRVSDATIYLRAGVEVGVASTKAFTSMVTVCSLLALLLARTHNMGKQEGQAFLQQLHTLPDKVKSLLDHSRKIQRLAKKYAHFNDFFFVGRHYMYPTCLEGALKLKEIAYVNANGYPAGEMKHGPIALISKECATVACASNQLTVEKLYSNLMEIKARKGPIVAICSESGPKISSITRDVITIPDTIDPLAPILTSVATQLFAYYIAKERGTEIDQPRNLAKSVTVE